MCLLRVKTPEIDAYTAGEFYAELMRAIEQTDGAGRIYVDMSEVTYMDSNGLGGLLTAYQHLDYEGLSIHIVAPSEPVRRVLEMAGLLEHFLIEAPKRTPDACASLDHPAALLPRWGR